MNITPLFSDSDLERWNEIFREKAEQKIILLLQAAGEEFVKIARINGSYENRTGNLRSSIGYVIVLDGKIQSENFQKSSSGTEGETGITKGTQIAQQVAATYKKGIILIGVAGMQYAIYVEAMEGIDVIAGASIRCEMWLKKAIKTVFERAA